MATTINAPTPITPSTKAAPGRRAASPSIRTQPDERLLSLDAYRGFIMIVLASGGLGIYEVARKHFPDDPTWQTLGYHFHHVKWLGCAFWDLIQPSFMFMVVGVAMAFSYAARAAHGQPYWRMLVQRDDAARSCWSCWACFAYTGRRHANELDVHGRGVTDRAPLHVSVSTVG